jgi:phage terminase large subunit GpA-like protein
VDKVEPSELYERREYFGEAMIPEGTVAMTMAVDSQADGFYWLLACWGRKLEMWLPATGRIIGDMRSAGPWGALLKVLATTWLDKDGNGWRPVVSAIDVQGEFYPETLAFVREKGWKYKLRAIRGYGVEKRRAGPGIGILRNVFTDKSTLVRVQNVDTDAAKTQLANMLARSEPGPAFVHLPAGRQGEDVRGWDFETVAELTSEYRRQLPARGGYTTYQRFKRPGRPNHRLDTLVYALAALSMSRLKIDTCPPQRIKARTLLKEQQEAEKVPARAKPPIAFGAQPGSGPEASNWGVQSQVIQRDPGQKRTWGVQPGSGLWNP